MNIKKITKIKIIIKNKNKTNNKLISEYTIPFIINTLKIKSLNNLNNWYQQII